MKSAVCGVLALAFLLSASGCAVCQSRTKYQAIPEGFIIIGWRKIVSVSYEKNRGSKPKKPVEFVLSFEPQDKDLHQEPDRMTFRAAPFEIIAVSASNEGFVLMKDNKFFIYGVR